MNDTKKSNFCVLKPVCTAWISKQKLCRHYVTQENSGEWCEYYSFMDGSCGNECAEDDAAHEKYAKLTSMIGGFDYIINRPEISVASIFSLIIDAFEKYWPDGLFQDADSDCAMDISEAKHGGNSSSEFFLYRNARQFDEWKLGTVDYSTCDSMIHVLIGDTITFVVDSKDSAHMPLIKSIEAQI